MPHTEARPWWADVQHVREAIERRRGATDHAGGDVTAVRENTGPLSDAPVGDEAAAGSRRRWEHAEPRWERVESRSERFAEPRWQSRPGRFAEPRWERVESRAERFAPPRPEPEEPRWDRVAEPLTDHRHVALTDHRHAADPRGDRGPAPATHTAPGAASVRRTVRITGRPDDRGRAWRPMEIERRRPARRPAERIGHRPDRIAMWAVLLGFFLILVAAASSHAATPSAHRAPGASHTRTAAVAPAADLRGVRLRAATAARRAG